MRSTSTRKRRNTILGHLLSLGALVILLPGAAQAANVTVDCDTPGADFSSITDALNALDLEGPHTITVFPGTCNEHVAIFDRERLTIDAPDGNVFIVSPSADLEAVTILGSHDIMLLRLGISGSTEASGLFIGRGSEVVLQGLTVEGNDAGIFVTLNSTVRLESSVVQNNSSDGLFATADSFVRISGTEFGNNGNIGIFCRDGSECNLQGGVNSHDNGFAGMAVINRSFVRAVASEGPNTVQGNASYGIVMTRNSSAAITSAAGGNTITGNGGPGIELDANSSLQLLNATVTNNSGRGVSVLRLSVGEFVGSNTISGNGGANLACDVTSLLAGELAGISKVDCFRVERTNGPPRPGSFQ